MGPGLPGLGIASIFYVAAALFAPFRELVLTVQGKSSRARWRTVLTQATLATITVAAVVGQYMAIDRLITSGRLPSARGPEALAGIPNYMYAFGACAAVLLVVSALAVSSRLFGTDEDPEVIAAKHRLGIVGDPGLIDLTNPYEHPSSAAGQSSSRVA